MSDIIKGDQSKSPMQPSRSNTLNGDVHELGSRAGGAQRSSERSQKADQSKTANGKNFTSPKSSDTRNPEAGAPPGTIVKCISIPKDVQIPPGTVLGEDYNVYQANGVRVGKLDLSAPLPFTDSSGRALHAVAFPDLPISAVLASDGHVYERSPPHNIIGQIDMSPAFIVAQSSALSGSENARDATTSTIAPSSSTIASVASGAGANARRESRVGEEASTKEGPSRESSSVPVVTARHYPASRPRPQRVSPTLHSSATASSGVPGGAAAGASAAPSASGSISSTFSPSPPAANSAGVSSGGSFSAPATLPSSTAVSRASKSPAMGGSPPMGSPQLGTPRRSGSPVRDRNATAANDAHVGNAGSPRQQHPQHQQPQKQRTETLQPQLLPHREAQSQAPMGDESAPSAAPHKTAMIQSVASERPLAARSTNATASSLSSGASASLAAAHSTAVSGAKETHAGQRQAHDERREKVKSVGERTDSNPHDAVATHERIAAEKSAAVSHGASGKLSGNPARSTSSGPSPANATARAVVPASSLPVTTRSVREGIGAPLNANASSGASASNRQAPLDSNPSSGTPRTGHGKPIPASAISAAPFHPAATGIAALSTAPTLPHAGTGRSDLQSKAFPTSNHSVQQGGDIPNAAAHATPPASPGNAASTPGPGPNGHAVRELATPAGVKLPAGCWLGVDHNVYNRAGKRVGHISLVRPGSRAGSNAGTPVVGGATPASASASPQHVQQRLLHEVHIQPGSMSPQVATPVATALAAIATPSGSNSNGGGASLQANDSMGSPGNTAVSSSASSFSGGSLSQGLRTRGSGSSSYSASGYKAGGQAGSANDQTVHAYPHPHNPASHIPPKFPLPSHPNAISALDPQPAGLASQASTSTRSRSNSHDDRLSGSGTGGVTPVYAVAPPQGVVLPPGCWLGSDNLVYDVRGLPVAALPPAPNGQTRVLTPRPGATPPLPQMGETQEDAIRRVLTPTNHQLPPIGHGPWDEPLPPPAATLDMQQQQIHSSKTRTSLAQPPPQRHRSYEQQIEELGHSSRGPAHSRAPEQRGGSTHRSAAGKRHGDGGAGYAGERQVGTAPYGAASASRMPPAALHSIPVPTGVTLPEGFWLGSDMTVYNEQGVSVGSLKPAPERIKPPPGVDLPDGAWLGSDFVVYDANGCRIGELKRLEDADEDSDEDNQDLVEGEVFDEEAYRGTE